MSQAQDMLDEFASIGKQLSAKFNLKDLHDTPTSYIGGSGKFLQVNDNEDGVGYASLSGQVSSQEIDWLVYSTISDLPSASEHHGMFAHVHSEGAAYMAHAGNWEKIYPVNAGSLTFTGLSDTPNSYYDGKILQSTTTGLAWVDMPTGGGGGGGGGGGSSSAFSNNAILSEWSNFYTIIPDALILEDGGGNTGIFAVNQVLSTDEIYYENRYEVSGPEHKYISFKNTSSGEVGAHNAGISTTVISLSGLIDNNRAIYYGGSSSSGGGIDSIDDITDLPDNPTDGQLITVGCDLYIGCDGQWVKVGADAVAPPSEAPACVSNLEEYNQYTEYKDQFLADNSNASFSAGLNNQTNIHDFVHDVCLFADSNLSQERNTVVIDETTYKWGMFAGDQNINIRAQAFSDSNVGSCTFKEWRSNLPNFPKTNAQETIFIDQDASITGHFECTVAPSQPSCNQVALHLQPDTGETIADKSDNQYTVTTVGDTVVDNTATLFGGGTMNFDGNGDALSVGDTSTFKFLHDDTTDYTVEFWHRLDQINQNNHVLATIITSSSEVGIFSNVRQNGQLYYHIHRGQDSTIFKEINSQIGTISANVWNHVVIVNQVGQDLKMYLNGVSISDQGSSFTKIASPSANNHGSALHIGGVLGQLSNGSMNGQIQDLRISKKVVYTANFTPPTNLLGNPCGLPGDQPSCSEVDFHLQASSGGTVEDKSDNNRTITNPNNVTNQSFISNSATLFGESTLFFDISRLLHFYPTNFGSNDFTVEFWIKYYSTVTTSTKDIIATKGRDPSSTVEFSIALNQDTLRFVNNLIVESTSTGMASVLNNWTHIAVVRSGNSLYLYVNGQREIDVTMNGSVYASPYELEIGCKSAAGGWTNNTKHIQDYRISKKAVYTTNFTPPTTLLPTPC